MVAIDSEVATTANAQQAASVNAGKDVAGFVGKAAEMEPEQTFANVEDGGQSGLGLVADKPGVTIKAPVDSILSPFKCARHDSGPAIPSSCESVFGSSPDLPHKDPHVQLLPVRSDTGPEVSSLQSPVSTQFGSSICPEIRTMSMED